MRRMIITREVVSFAFANDEVEIDSIPLSEVDYVVEMKEMRERRSSMVHVAAVDNGGPALQSSGALSGGNASHGSLDVHAQAPLLSYSLQIATLRDGHNSGRSYYIQTDSKESLDFLIQTLVRNSKLARKRLKARNFFRKAQYTARKWYETNVFQAVVALLICAVRARNPHSRFTSLTQAMPQNFVCTIIESQFMNGPNNNEQSTTELAVLMERLNLFFTLIFTVELCLNAFCYWFRPFIRNAWNILDTFIITMSLISTVITNEPTGIVRILRALRVIRLFGRVKSLKKIISALTMAMLPVLNVFLILFLLISIGVVPSHRPPPTWCDRPGLKARLANAP